MRLHKIFTIRASRDLLRVWLALAAALLLYFPSAPASANGNHFYSGYCTWDAAEQAHAAWGVWLPWYGDAGDWGYGARAAGWTVSTVPRKDSILMMPRYVQGSGSYGHVAWVLDVDPDGGAVTVRSMNWAGYGVVNVHRVAVDGLVEFITPPAVDASFIEAS